jgi:hypothetical protein
LPPSRRWIGAPSRSGLEIERIDKPGAIELTYFPYTTPWRETYRIRFPLRTLDGRETLSPQAHWLGLRFAGAQGNQQLIWEISGPDQRTTALP